ncbi:MAG: cell division protein ZapA [Mediterranea sp.]|nr:cell division protein ZapA [Mediterranea sp.]
MNDKIRINLQMAGSSFPLTINREEEEIVRSAAKQVETRLNAYRSHFPNQSTVQLITMVAYQFALENLQNSQRNDTAPFVHRIAALSQMLDSYFDQLNRPQPAAENDSEE